MMNKKIGTLLIIGIMVITMSLQEKQVDAAPKGAVEEKTYKINQVENIVLLGDSIFEWYKTDTIFDDLPVINSGVAGNKTYDVLDNLEQRVYQYNPTKVLINIGTNDIPGEDSEEINQEVVKNIKKIIENIRNHRKNCKVYLISIYPVNNSMPSALERHSSEIKEINEELKKYCALTSNATYIDVFSQFIDENEQLKKEFTVDGLHFNDLGYAKLTEILMKYIYQ